MIIVVSIVDFRRAEVQVQLWSGCTVRDASIREECDPMQGGCPRTRSLLPRPLHRLHRLVVGVGVGVGVGGDHTCILRNMGRKAAIQSELHSAFSPRMCHELVSFSERYDRKQRR
jgi:hypothetical protein